MKLRKVVDAILGFTLIIVVFTLAWFNARKK